MRCSTSTTLAPELTPTCELGLCVTPLPELSGDARGLYFKLYYPYDALAALLSRSGKDLVFREFGCQGGNAGVSYWRRHLHPKTRGFHVPIEVHSKEIQVELMTQKLKDGRRIPFELEAIHIGAVFSREPAKGSKESVPEQRELTFDIDLTDYPHLHLDKSDVAGCDAAWPMVAFGLDLIGSILQNQFGYSEFVRWYSGRRGAHMWVLDEHACKLTKEGRMAVEGFCNLKCDRNGAATVDTLELARSYDLYDGCYEFFLTVGLKPRSEGGLGLLDHDDDVRLLFEMTGIRHPALQDLPNQASAASAYGTHRWEVMMQILDTKPWLETLPWAPDAMRRAMLAFVWPRLDAKVTTGFNHMVKAPFSMHSSTRRLCVPIFDSAYDFVPASTPTGEEVVSDETGTGERQTLATAVERLMSEVVSRTPVLHPTVGCELPPLSLDEAIGAPSDAMDIEDLVAPTTSWGIPITTHTMRAEIEKEEVEYSVEVKAWFLKVDRVFYLKRQGETITMSVQWVSDKSNAFFGRFESDVLPVEVRSEDDSVAPTRLVNCMQRLQTGVNPSNKWVRVIKDTGIFIVLSDLELSPKDVKDRFRTLQRDVFNKHHIVANMSVFRDPTPTRSHFEMVLSKHRDWVLMTDD